MTTLVSRELIARLADNAAARWTARPELPKPTCPFNQELQPDHAKAWKASFERALVFHSTPECEVSA